MEQGRIPDHAITASSSYEAKSVGPQNARIRQEKNGGAWCPKAQISGEVHEYLEVDLVRDHLITWTETQGRFGNGQGQEYAEAFLVEYWRAALDRWVIYKDARGDKVLTGNSNTYLVVRQELELPFVASRVRFIPYSEHPRTVCMRVEIYGCPWERNLLRYTAPRSPDIGPSGASIQDSSYDGPASSQRANFVTGGLGQLTDGLFGDDDFLDEYRGPNSGSRWVGWSNDTTVSLDLEKNLVTTGIPGGSSNNGGLELLFEFDGPREFTSVHLHVNNMFTRGVQIPSSISFYFSLDGERYQPVAVVHRPIQDRTGESSRNITVPLQNRVGRFVRAELEFSSQWILLSEITFDSAPVIGNLTDEILEQYYLLQDASAQQNNAVGSNVPTNTPMRDLEISGDLNHREDITPRRSGPVGHTQAYVGLITGALAVLALALACTVFLMIRRGRKKVALLHKHTALVSSGGGSSAPGLVGLSGLTGGKQCQGNAATITMKELQLHLSTPVLTSRTRLTLKAPPYGDVARQSPAAAPQTVTTPPPNAAPLAEDSDSETSSVYHEPYRLLPSSLSGVSGGSKATEYGCLLRKDNGKTQNGDGKEYSTGTNGYRDEVKFYHLPPPPPPAGARPPPAYDSNSTFTPSKTGTMKSEKNGISTNGQTENYYAATDIVKTERREQHFTPGRFTTIKLPDGPPLEGVARLLDFPRRRLRALKKLGEGAFGTVHLCETEGVSDFGNSASTLHRKQLVIVKALWRNTSEQTKQEFIRECTWLAGVRDPHLARVVGLCGDEPPCILLEHSELGDLPEYLRSQTAKAESSTLSYGCLIYMATQIASGMKYLESLELVHRDLAARNCVVGKDLAVKVSDHAMYCDKYEGDYYRSDTKAKLPIRWMAWEALLLGKQTPKSDVWSFAVTLWELLTLCAQRPLSELTNEQVVENSSRWYRASGTQRLPPRPATCPRELYDLMAECWKRSAADRPRFSEIHLFLQRKNLGYAPTHA
ncbi:discoidin domain-containing receptor 2-like isoform X2 [Ctenocephalides felis]|uniref:discoidin domain-containing receptor 2-like isoform X2 n=1 Tax=Ctenocephalides felis TaxID=7515 RepID=UPI000E6E23C6|nr:discoidin domain-containing receptor 2-like isoform X2 [Ctenocephalides felis]